MIDKKTQGKNEFSDCLEFSEKQSFTSGKKVRKGKLVPAKHKFRGIGIPLAIGTGMPDFIAFTNKVFVFEGVNMLKTINLTGRERYNIFGVEVKSNGYLDKLEKEKCKWLLENKIFSKILIASKIKEKNRIKIEYKEFKWKYHKKITMLK